MTKSFDSAGQITNKETKERLVQLMDNHKVSLIHASQILKIPYTVAKQILFTYASNRTVAQVMSNSAKLSPIAKSCKRYYGSEGQIKSKKFRENQQSKKTQERKQPRASMSSYATS
jgi:hypothetical protein